MKLKAEFITHKGQGSQEEQVMVSTDTKLFSGLVRSNSTASFIIDCLKQETTQEAIVEAMSVEYDAPNERIEQDVAKIIAQLRSIGAIDG